MSARLIGPGVALLVAVVLVAVAFFGDDTPVTVDASDVDAASTPAADAATPDEAASPASDRPSRERMAPLRIETDSGLAIGDPEAPLVMVAFESYGCLWCGMFHRETLPMVMTEWVDTGRLRIETRVLPYEPRALPGSKIAVAAARQGLYWELGEHLYPFIAGGGEPPVGRELTDDEWSEYRVRQSEEALLAQAALVADEIGLDMDRLRADLDDETTNAIVERDEQLAWQVGFTGTPAFVVNGVPQGGYSGPESFSSFLQAVADASEE